MRIHVARVAVIGCTVAAAAAVATPPEVASAATACTAPDMYAHRTVSPANATGGANVSGAKFGSAVAVGDFNKDGYRDVAVGAPGDQVGGVSAGTVTIFNGSATGMSTTGKRLTQTDGGSGNEAGDRFGAALAAGDFNKDGYADLAVGIPGEAIAGASGAGAITVFMGSSSGLTTGTWHSQTLGGGTDEAGDGFATALAAGDLNGDGYADLAIGAPGEAPSGGTVKSGAGYVYKGSSTGIVKGWPFDQTDAAGANEAGDKFGQALAIGNVVGDSHADLVVGAPGEAPGTDPVSGAIYVIPGSSTGKGTGFAHSQEYGMGANEAGDAFGSSLAVGNVDKDAYADVVVGIPGESPGTDPQSGSVGVFPGGSTDLASGFVINEDGTGETQTAGDKYGTAVAAGDVDGDGYADVLIGAPGKAYGGATGAGAVYLFTGGPRDSGSTRSIHHGRRIGQNDLVGTNESGDAFGAAVVLADLTGDGKADGVIGSSGEALPGQPASGTAIQATNLAARANSPIALESFTPTAAMQATPTGGASVGTLEYAYSDNIGRLLHGHQSDPDNFSSVAWTVVSGTEAFAGTPALGEQADGKLHLAAHDSDSTVRVDIETATLPPTWAPWTTPTGSFSSHPTLVRQSDGTLVGFAVDAGGVLWALPEAGSNKGYTSWVSLGVGGLSGTPVAVPVSGGVRVFALTPDGSVATVLYAANRTFSGCSVLDGTGFTGTPGVVAYPGSLLRVFARAADGSIRTIKQDGTGAWPTTWDTVGTFTAAGAPSAVLSPSTGKTELVARGSDGAVYSTGETLQGSGTWRDWVKVTADGDVAATDPTTFAYSGVNGQSWAFVFRTSDNVSRVYQVVNTGLASSSTAAPAFGGHSLPVPPAVHGKR